MHVTHTGAYSTVLSATGVKEIQQTAGDVLKDVSRC